MAEPDTPPFYLIVTDLDHGVLLVAGFSLRDLPAALENATSSWLP